MIFNLVLLVYYRTAHIFFNLLKDDIVYLQDETLWINTIYIETLFNIYEYIPG